MVNRILLLMNQHNVTGKELTYKLDISPSAVSEWKKSKTKPSLEALIGISEMFDVSLDWLITGKGEMYKEESAEPSANNEADPLTESEDMLLNNYREMDKQQKRELINYSANLLTASRETADDNYRGGA